MIEGCAAGGATGREGTWINDRIRSLYRALVRDGPRPHDRGLGRTASWSGVCTAWRWALRSSARACSTAGRTPRRWRLCTSWRGCAPAASAFSTRNSSPTISPRSAPSPCRSRPITCCSPTQSSVKRGVLGLAERRARAGTPGAGGARGVAPGSGVRLAAVRARGLRLPLRRLRLRGRVRRCRSSTPPQAGRGRPAHVRPAPAATARAPPPARRVRPLATTGTAGPGAGRASPSRRRSPGSIRRTLAHHQRAVDLLGRDVGEAGLRQHRDRSSSSSASANGPISPGTSSGVGRTGATQSSGFCIHSQSERRRQQMKAKRPPSSSAAAQIREGARPVVEEHHAEARHHQRVHRREREQSLRRRRSTGSSP